MLGASDPHCFLVSRPTVSANDRWVWPLPPRTPFTSDIDEPVPTPAPRCRNFDGGFGCIPGAESHAGQIFTCVGALSIARSLHLVDEGELVSAPPPPHSCPGERERGIQYPRPTTRFVSHSYRSLGPMLPLSCVSREQHRGESFETTRVCALARRGVKQGEGDTDAMIPRGNSVTSVLSTL